MAIEWAGPVANLIWLRDAAQKFGVSEITLYRYLRKGVLTRYRRAADTKTYLDLSELTPLFRQAHVIPPRGPAK